LKTAYLSHFPVLFSPPRKNAGPQQGPALFLYKGAFSAAASQADGPALADDDLAHIILLAKEIHLLLSLPGHFVLVYLPPGTGLVAAGLI
jgi:hypothetical protein